MSFEENERVVAQRVANAIEAIAIYETKTNLSRKSISQTKRQKEKTENKKRLDNTSKNNQNQQQPNKRQNIGRAYTSNIVGHLARDCRSSTNANTTNIQKGTGASQKTTCHECGNQGHYKRDCLERKNQNNENQIKSTKARGVVHAFGGGETEQDLNNIEDEIEA
nr:hypothetical protein [Tanacetum cinerariifolium]